MNKHTAAFRKDQHGQATLEFQMVLVFLTTALVLSLTFFQVSLAAYYTSFIDALNAYFR